MKLGIGSYTYPWAVGVPGHIPSKPLTVVELLAAAKALGVHMVQVCDNLPLTALSPREIVELAALASDHEISLELGTRGLDEENLLSHLALAKEFKASFVRVVIDAKGHQPSPAETVELLRPVVARFAEVGVKLAIENHDRFTAATLAWVVQELGPAHVGICLDTVNSFGALEGPECVVRVLAPYALNLHVKDFTIQRVSSQMGFVIEGCAAGRGKLNVPGLLDLLRSAGRDVNAILELWTPYGRSLDATIERERAWAEESVRYLRRYITE